MARPTARVLALLEILQAGGTRTTAELAERLEVDERTVRRYVGHLVDLDVPVRTERGRYGGYRLAPGYRMPPLMLTDDEALAVLLGLLAGRRSRSVNASASANEAAIAKLRRVLPVAVGRRLDVLMATVEFTDPARPEASADTRVILMMAEAARDHHPVAIGYTDREGNPSERTVHPYGIVAHSRHWYVAGADSITSDVRTFRLDRIQHATVLTGSFEVPDGFDPVAGLLTEAPHRYQVSVRVEGTLDHLRARLPATVATLQEITPGSPTGPGATAGGQWVRVRIRAERLDWIPALLASLDRPFVIEQPDSLRDAMHSLASRLATYADATP